MSQSAVRAGAEVGEVTTADALEALRPEWAALWDRCPTATPFQSPEWLLAWWRHLGGRGLWTLTLRRSGRLVGLLPLFVWHDPDAGLRRALLIGTGHSDYLDALIEPGTEGGAEALLAPLAEHRDRWDVCEFHQLRGDSPLLAELPGWHDETTPQVPCPVLALPDRVEELSRCVPPGLLARLRYHRRRAAADGPVRVDRAEGHNFDELFDALLRLHDARWSAAGEPGGVLADEAVRLFHREAALGLLRAGVLRLYGLRLAGRVIAALYGFRCHGRAWYYLCGFDPGFGPLSPGTMIFGHAIEEAVREGCGEFDFLRGREPYKYRWGAADRPTYRRCLRPPVT